MRKEKRGLLRYFDFRVKWGGERDGEKWERECEIVGMKREFFFLVKLGCEKLSS
jgi:hypothetical protein